MVKHASYKIVVDGVNVTKKITPFFISMSIVDNEKKESDELTLVVSKKFKRPAFGGKIKVYIDNVFCGLFYVKKHTITNNATLTISATGINFQSGIKTRKNTRLEQTTLANLAAKIAKDHGLKVKTDANAIVLDVDQVNESDMHLLDRLAKEHGAIFNIKNDTLYFTQRELTTPSIAVDINKCIDSEITHTTQTNYKSCIVIYHDTKKNKYVSVTVGKGEPPLTKQGQFKNDAEARVYATNALKRSKNKAAEGNITIPGKIAFAGGKITLDGATYTMTRVEQTLDSGGWLTMIEFNGRDSGSH